MPEVSIIIPCLNEYRTIKGLLQAVYEQSYPRQQMEVVIADGLSTDGTREQIADFAQEHPDLPIQVVDNPTRVIPAGLNRALQAARGEFIVRLDAHSQPRRDYVERVVAALKAGKGDNVGGVWDIQPGGESWIARAIAVAAAHPLGVGDAHYRYTASAREADTVPFGGFRRALVDELGGFDETLLTNEDYEFNVRIRRFGGRIWLDPAIRSTYYARANLSALARQYWRYGFWKAHMLRRYLDTLRWRQAIPPAFVLSLILLGLLSWASPLFGLVLLAEVVSYALILLAAGLQSALAGRDATLLLGVPLAMATMHLSWGAAFLWSALRQLLGLAGSK